MPSIYLGMQSSSFSLASVTVKEELYPTSNLFKKFKHTSPSNDRSGNIYLFKSSSALLYYYANSATLQPGVDYSTSSLEHADVYFNRFDTNTPLVCFLKFDRGQDRIYQHSKHGTYIDQSSIINLHTLTESTSEKDILTNLLDENDKLTELLTYDIGKKQGDRSSSNEYNGNKITVQDDSHSISELRVKGFMKYKHEPQALHYTKSSCVIYNNNLLLDNTKKELSGIQNKNYKYINVYWSDKIGEPLLVEFNKEGPGSITSNQFFYHTWEGNDGDNKELYWKEITKGGKVLGVELTAEKNVYSELTESGGIKLVKILQKLELHLLKTIYFIIDKKEAEYGLRDIISSFTNSSKHRLINKIIRPEDKTSSTEWNCLDKTGFKVYEHDFTTSVKNVQDGKETVRLRLIIPNSSSAHQYEEITLHKGDKGSEGNETLEYNSSKKCLYVFYYDADPRPLLICHGGSAYMPRKQSEPLPSMQVIVEYTTWDRVGGVSKCVCENGGIDGSNGQLLKALTDVVGFLNPVQINPKQIPREASTQITKEPRTSPVNATYNLHTYITETTVIKMGITSTDVECYNKYTYQPYGTNGQSTNTRAEGFRLGTVFHGNSSQSHKHSPLNYINESSYQYHPLVCVTVYYYDKDDKYDDPLLIELEFKKNGGGGDGTGPKEYYKLQPGNGGDTLQWEKDDNAKLAINGGVENTQKLIAHLDSIRHSLKKVVKILLDKQQGYPLCLSAKPGGTGNGYSQHNGKQIEVSQYTQNGCSELSDRGYICYQHKVSAIANGGSGFGTFNYNTIGGLKFYISGNGTGGGGANDIEIPLHNGGDTKINKLTYNQCMGDVYVFFYCKNGTEQGCPSPVPESKPTAPLMLYYNKGYYRPKDIDEYFEKWVCESNLPPTTIKEPCGGDAHYQTLANKLNEVNKSLNRIKLTESGQYGISKPSGPPNDPNIVLDRIKVTKQGPKPERPYCKLVHRTMNAFDIGDIYYNDKDIKSGVQINGPGTIKVSSPNHTTNFVYPPGTNTPNTVVAYYHMGDDQYTLPQLIVLLHTEKAIEDLQSQGTEPITATSGSNYGYYVLATGTGANNYKYEWREPKDPQPDPFKLEDQTEFKLLNSVVIMVDKQTTYNEVQISSALSKSTTIRSPGNKDGVNRLKDRDITVNDESSNEGGKCVKKYGYVLKSHDLTATTKRIFDIQPILGLRFLIPSSTKTESYDEVTLYTNESASQDVGPLYHTSPNNTVYVYFYDRDPRPLLMCFGTDAYIPQKKGEPTPGKQVDVDYTKWVQETKIKSCVCSGENSESPTKEILETLLNVVLFLNPVQLNPEQIPNQASSQIIPTEPPKPPTPKEATYNLHEYKHSSHVKMKITRENVECYEKYTYEPNGTNGSGTGFRLGTVLYRETGDKPKGTVNYYELSPSSKYNPLLKVTVFYYDHDKKYEEPLLVELMFKFDWYFETSYKKEYYKLASVTGTGPSDMKWTIDSAARGAIGDGKDGDNQKLITYLDKIRYQFKKVLEIKIAIKKSESYQANLLKRNNDQPVESKDVIQVPVSEEHNCQSIKGTGFRCFKHEITKVGSPNLHKIGALQFLIPGKEGTKLVKLNLYGTPRTGAIEPLYYNCSMGDIYVYFYGTGSGSGGQGVGDGDPRPLLLCYNNHPYRAWCMETYDKQSWYRATQIKNCLCNKPGDEFLLRALVRVSNFLNPVNILERPTCMNKKDYFIHKFNGKEITIQVSVTKAENKFCYHKYTHEHNGTGNSPKCGKGFRLGNITYNSEWIVDKENTDKCITSLTTRSPKYDPASEVVVYYYKGDKTYQNPLLIALKNNRETYNPYYELLRDSIGNRRMYLKEDKNINLEEKPGTDLEKILDRILFSISKRLQILLDKRPDPIPLCPIERKRIKLLKTKKPLDQLSYEDIGLQLLTNALFGAADISQDDLKKRIKSNKTPNRYDYINEKNCEKRKPEEFDPKITTRIPSYPARVYNNTGQREQGTSGTTRIKVQKIESKELTNTGYICYRHLLTQIADIDNFGGLRLFLWDNRTSDDNDSQCKPSPPTTLDTKPKCCEIDLHGENTSKIDPIAYTTCKGDLYVYFYGSDPRPMLLCYNGQGYTGRISRVI